jgi:hypothetical protein
MAYVIYAEKIAFEKEYELSHRIMKEQFRTAIELKETLLADDRRIACFFIDPLLRSFEAANRFYFGVLECDTVQRINAYKSGAGPIQALADAKELIDCDLCDAVFLFGCEPLLSDTRKYGKEAIANAMEIIEDHSLIRCYDRLARRLCREIGLSRDGFRRLADKLYENHVRVFQRISGRKDDVARGRILHEHGTDLFHLTDCANPNIDFAGGLVVAGDRVVERLNPDGARLKILGVGCRVTEGAPQAIPKIVGDGGNLFPHLREAFAQAQLMSGIDVKEEFEKRNLLLEVYTCYPPIPIAFLLTAGFARDVGEMDAFLDRFEITLTGGMNLAKAPWNNPALNGLIELSKRLFSGDARYGLVHGNGGIGEAQGVAILGQI